MRLLILLAAFLLLAGCGASAPRMSYADERPAPSAPAEPEAQTSTIAGYYEGEEDSAKSEPSPVPLMGQPGGSFGEKSAGTKDAFKKSDGPSAPPAPPAPPMSPPPAADPVVIYSGYLRLRVRRVLEAVDRITARVESVGGYIESLTARTLVVRVPVADFDAALKAFEALGTVLGREVRSVDVTARYTDLSARLAVARQSRERLLVLLERTTDTRERLRLLREIKRLSEVIETIQSTLSTLRKLADFSTITVDLVPAVETHATQVHRSPFGWIRGMEAHRTTLPEGKGRIGFQVPRGFVIFEEDEAWRAQAADTSTLRAGTVDNEPRGDAAFWSAAIDHEMTGRDEEPVAEGTDRGVAWRVYRSRDTQPRYALIAVRPVDDTLLVLEGFFPADDAWQRHKDAVLPALGTLEAR